MARPRSISTERILDAARKCFLDQGYGVSTIAIAKEAGISEGSIFRRFPTKEDLFLAAMGLPSFEPARNLERRVGQGTIDEQLVEVATEILGFFRLVVPRVTMLCSHPAFDPITHFKGRTDSPPVLLLRTLTHYFDAEMKLGRLRRGDPQVAARMLLGSLHNFVFLEQLGVQEHLPLEAESFVRGVVDILLAGLRPAP